MRIAVSACLLGENCRYNGGNNASDAVKRFCEGQEVLALCPELLGGLPVPREPAELREGIVMTRSGVSVDRQFREGAQAAAAQAVAWGAELAVLQPRSPSCGAGQIYDGSFSGRLVDGDGVFAALLKAHGIRVLTPGELNRNV